MDTKTEYTYDGDMRQVLLSPVPFRSIAFSAALVTIVYAFLANAGIALSDVYTVDSMKWMKFVSVDRRPEKNMKYDLCFGRARVPSAKVSFVAAIEPKGERKCGLDKTKKFDFSEKQVWDPTEQKMVEANHTVSEDGAIVSQNDVFVTQKAWDTKLHYKGRDWQYAWMPYRITYKKPNAQPPIDDSFCVVNMVSVDENDNELARDHIACDDCSSLQKCIDTKLETKDPLPEEDETKLTRHSQQTRTTERPTHR